MATRLLLATGGYPETGLSDIALAWITGRATECERALDGAAVNIQLAPKADGPLHDSMTWYYRMFGELCARYLYRDATTRDAR